MLINLSNHPSKNWSKAQIDATEKQFGIVRDIPFPKVVPNADKEEIEKLTDTYFLIIMEKLKLFPDKNNAVHLMGELNFTFSLVNKLLANNVKVVVSTSNRNTIDKQNGKITKFDFVRFREY